MLFGYQPVECANPHLGGSQDFYFINWRKMISALWVLLLQVSRDTNEAQRYLWCSFLVAVQGWSMALVDVLPPHTPYPRWEVTGTATEGFITINVDVAGLHDVDGDEAFSRGARHFPPRVRGEKICHLPCQQRIIAHCLLEYLSRPKDPAAFQLHIRCSPTSQTHSASVSVFRPHQDEFVLDTWPTSPACTPKSTFFAISFLQTIFTDTNLYGYQCFKVYKQNNLFSQKYSIYSPLPSRYLFNPACTAIMSTEKCCSIDFSLILDHINRFFACVNFTREAGRQVPGCCWQVWEEEVLFLEKIH